MKNLYFDEQTKTWYGRSHYRRHKFIIEDIGWLLI
jgi:hypothetical protein